MTTRGKLICAGVAALLVIVLIAWKAGAESAGVVTLAAGAAAEAARRRHHRRADVLRSDARSQVGADTAEDERIDARAARARRAAVETPETDDDEPLRSSLLDRRGRS